MSLDSPSLYAIIQIGAYVLSLATCAQPPYTKLKTIPSGETA